MTNKEIANRIRAATKNAEELKKIADELDPLPKFPIGTKVLSSWSPGVVFEVVSQQEYEEKNGKFVSEMFRPVIFVKDECGVIYWNHTLDGYTIAPEPKPEPVKKECPFKVGQRVEVDGKTYEVVPAQAYIDTYGKHIYDLVSYKAVIFLKREDDNSICYDTAIENYKRVPKFDIGDIVKNNNKRGKTYTVISQEEYVNYHKGKVCQDELKSEIYLKDKGGFCMWASGGEASYTLVEKAKMDKEGVFYMGNISSPRIKDQNGNWFWVNEFSLEAENVLSCPSCFDCKANIREATMEDFEAFVKKNPEKAAKIIHNLAKFVVKNNK